jgi:DNA damage-binding protein 1
LRKFRPTASETDHLFFGTDRNVYTTISWDSEKKEIVDGPTVFKDIHQHGRSPTYEERCHIDPTNRLMVLELYQGTFTCIGIHEAKANRKALRGGSLQTDVGNLRVSEYQIRSSAFLHDMLSPTLAILYEDIRGKVHIKTYTFTVPGGEWSDKNFEEGFFKLSNLDESSSLLIAIPGTTGQ